jgi:hexosaminidase
MELKEGVWRSAMRVDRIARVCARTSLGVALWATPPVYAQTADAVAVLPRPTLTVVAGGEAAFDVPARVIVEVPANSSAATRAAAQQFAAALGTRSSADIAVRAGGSNPTSAARIVIDTSLASSNTEAYELLVKADGIALHARSSAGVRWGLNTLLQLVTRSAATPVRWTVPALRIVDEPRYAWRGSMIDVGRHLLTVRDIERHIDLLSQYKMNVLHWHLTDDQGWRIEIPRYPRLTSIGAWRREADGSRYGGFYTQAQIRGLVRYAETRGVTIVPEIEIPGHSSAALAAYPHLGCTNDTIRVPSSWGVFADVYCAGKEETFAFLFNVLDDVMALFPSPLIHVGGDEVPKDRWKACAECQAVMRREGLANEEELQSWFMRRIATHVAKRGRRIIGWDEVLDGPYVPNGVVQSWRDASMTKKAVARGFSVIASPSEFTYLNRSAGELGLRDVFAFNPMPSNLDATQRSRVMGGEVPLWSEHITSGANLELMALPRLLAFAEVLWSGSGGEYAEFARRVEQVHAPALRAKGYAIGPSSEPLVTMSIGFDTVTQRARLKLPFVAPGLVIRASTNGAQPTGASAVVRDGALLSESQTTRLQAFWGAQAVREERRVDVVRHVGVGARVTTDPVVDARYPGTGAFSLADGLRGSSDHGDGLWQGWWVPEVALSLALPRGTTGTRVEVRFLQNVRSWILLPRTVDISFSADSVTWSSPVSHRTDVPLTREGAIIHAYSTRAPSGMEARFVRVVARGGPLPAEHPGAGQPAWIFADEIRISRR